MSRLLARSARVFAVVCLILLAVAAFAITPLGYVSMTGSHLTDASGSPLSNATISFQPTNNSGTPISAQINGGGQGVTTPISAAVTSGAFTLQLADTALTAPANVCYNTTVTDNSTGNILLNYPCVQPAGSGAAVTSGFCSAATLSVGGACNFDAYVPTATPGAIVQRGPTGPAGPTGPTGPANYITSTAAPTAGCSASVNPGYFDLAASLVIYTCDNSTGTWQWNSRSGTGALPAGVTSPGAGSLVGTGTFQSKMLDAGGAFFNVSAWGVPLDGAADATSAMNTFVSIVNATSGAEIDIPPGIILSNTCNWTFTVPVFIHGAGSGINDNQTTLGSALKCSNASNPGLVLNGNLAMVRDLAIYNTATTPASTAIGISIGGSLTHQKVSLENVYGWGWYDAVHENGAYWDIGEGSQFTNNVRGGIFINNTVNPDEGDSNAHNYSCNGGPKTNSSATAGSSACVYWVSGGGVKLSSFKSNATITHGIYVNCNSCGTNQFLVNEADIENTTNAPIFMTSSSGFTSVIISNSFLSGPSTFPDIDLDAHIGGTIISGNDLQTYGSSGLQPEAILCGTGVAGVLMFNNLTSGNFTTLTVGCQPNYLDSTTISGYTISGNAGFQIGCTAASNCNAPQVLKFADPSGSSTITSSWSGNGLTFTLPRTSTGKGYHFANNGGTDVGFLDGGDGHFNLPTAGATYQIGGVNIMNSGPALTAATTITSTSFTTTGLVLPTVPASATQHGRCHLVWEQSTAAATVSFGFGASTSPTGLWILSKINNAAAGTQAVAYATITNTTTTIVGAATTPGAAATPYYADFDFVAQNPSGPVLNITLYGLTSNASDALVIEPGSYCSWQP